MIVESSREKQEVGVSKVSDREQSRKQTKPNRLLQSRMNVGLLGLNSTINMTWVVHWNQPAKGKLLLRQSSWERKLFKVQQKTDKWDGHRLGGWKLVTGKNGRGRNVERAGKQHTHLEVIEERGGGSCSTGNKEGKTRAKRLVSNLDEYSVAFWAGDDQRCSKLKQTLSTRIKTYRRKRRRPSHTNKDVTKRRHTAPDQGFGRGAWTKAVVR